MMPIIYASCIAKRGTDIACLLYTVYIYNGRFIFETHLGKSYTILLSGELLLIYIFECK